MATGAYTNLDFNLGPVERVNAILQDLTLDSEYFGWDVTPTKCAKVVSAGLDSIGNGYCKFEATIPPALCNKTGVLHGGAACTLLDTLTSMPLAVMARKGFLDTGHVSRTITMSYLRPVPNGMKVTIESEVLAVGKSTANVIARLKNPQGKVCVTCTHDKAVFPTKRVPAKL